MHREEGHHHVTAHLATAAVLLLAGCGGGSGGGWSGANVFPPEASSLELAPPTLRILHTDPADGASSVPIDVQPKILFDSSVVLASFDAAQLRELPDRSPVEGHWEHDVGDDTAVFHPARPLRADTVYELDLTPLISSDDGRLLEQRLSIRFETVDTRAPQLVSSTPAAGGLLPRHADLTIRFDEELGTDASIHATIVDANERSWPASAQASEDTVIVAPLVDLPGDIACRLTLAGVADRHGNVSDTSQHEFATSPDRDTPRLIGNWPEVEGPRMSPHAWVRLDFDESIDVDRLDPARLRLRDQHGAIVPHTLHASADQRSLWLAPVAPLPSDSTCTLIPPGGSSGILDTSGNGIDFEAQLRFRVGSDWIAPRLLSISPADRTNGVPLDVAIELRFDEELAGDCAAAVELLDHAGRPVALASRLVVDRQSIVLVPARPLIGDSTYRIVSADRPEGIRDPAGNHLATTIDATFRTGSVFEDSTLWTWPSDDASDVPLDAQLVLHADAAWDPGSIEPAAFELVDASDHSVPVTVSLDRENRVLRIVPQRSLDPASRYALHIACGGAGPRSATGRCLAEAMVVRFYTGTSVDVTPPGVEVTIDAIDERRSDALGVAPFGFALTVSAVDDRSAGIDWSTLQVQLDGPGEVPDTATLFTYSRPESRRCEVRLPFAHALGNGLWSARASVADLAGNRGTSAAFTFEVFDAASGRVPFERTQVVWIRFDLDRDGSGTADFDEDLLRLGLNAAGDPAGLNARVRDLVADGVVRRAHQLYQREPDGSRRDDGGSVPILFTARRPHVAYSMQVACGGFDPKGERGRGFGDSSSGVLGRAFYDRANGRPSQSAIDTGPGLGVFPAEVFLFETSVHRSVYPAFVTSFARSFLPLCPEMGGSAVGTEPLDATVLAAEFDPETATSAQRARYESILSACDDWATVIGTVLAHEVGHAVGLVTPGAHAGGLHGDQTLHNEFASITDVMAATLGYDAIVSLDFEFRDLNIAYLRQRVLLK